MSCKETCSGKRSVPLLPLGEERHGIAARVLAELARGAPGGLPVARLAHSARRADGVR